MVSVVEVDRRIVASAEQSAPPESTDHFKINAQHELHQWQRLKLKSGNYFDTINPANERVLSRVTEVDVSPARNASTPLR